MTWNDHDHCGDYAGARHNHFGEYAEERHRHYDLEHDGKATEREIQGLRDDVRELRADLADALDRIASLEKQTPEARQLQLEADLAIADAAAAGYGPDDPVLSDACCDRWHERCPVEVRCDCECHVADEDQAAAPVAEPGGGPDVDDPDPDWLYDSDGRPVEYDPGPEVDDEGGMSEYRYLLPEDYQRGQS